MSARIADGWAYWDEFLYWKHFNKGISLKEKKNCSKTLWSLKLLRPPKKNHNSPWPFLEIWWSADFDEISLAMLMTEAIFQVELEMNQIKSKYSTCAKIPRPNYPFPCVNNRIGTVDFDFQTVNWIDIIEDLISYVLLFKKYLRAPKNMKIEQGKNA